MPTKQSEKKLEQKIKRREAKKRSRPAISGRSVFIIQRIKHSKRKKPPHKSKE